MKTLCIAAAILAMSTSARVASAADEAANGVVFKSRAELMATLAERAKATPTPEMTVANVKTGDGFMINVVRRTTPQGAIAHDVGTEIHSLIDGAATLVTGGTIARPADPAQRGQSTVQGGETRRVKVGDIIMVPPRTPHWYSAMNGVVTYLEIRFDVGAPAGGPATRMTDTAILSLLESESAAVPAPLTFSAAVAQGDRFQASVVVRTRPQDSEVHPASTEVLHVLDGSGTLVIGDSSREIAPGDVVLVPAGVSHWFKAVQDLRYLEVRFDLPKR